MKSVLTITTLAVLLSAAWPADAGRNNRHKVKPGDSIANIARYHGVSQDDLRSENDLGPKDSLQPGDVLTIPKQLMDGWTIGHVVKKGDTLARIARRYKVDVDEIRQINRIGKKGRLELGRRLVIPKGERVTYEAPSAKHKAKSGGEASKSGKTGKVVKKAKWDGKATVVRVRGKSERKTMTMFDKRGRVRTYAKRTISKLARSRKGKIRWLHNRLIKLLGKVAERYPGHDIEIISGYRPHKRGKKKRSQHSRARAVDFRVRGVNNLELYNYLKTFDKVGVGYYPNSSFVHFDVRDKKYMWTDVSGPGEKARYLRSGSPGTAENPSTEAAADVEAIDDGDQEPDPENFPEEE